MISKEASILSLITAVGLVSLLSPDISTPEVESATPDSELYPTVVVSTPIISIPTPKIVISTPIVNPTYAACATTISKPNYDFAITPIAVSCPTSTAAFLRTNLPIVAVGFER